MDMAPGAVIAQHGEALGLNHNWLGGSRRPPLFPFFYYLPSLPPSSLHTGANGIFVT